MLKVLTGIIFEFFPREYKSVVIFLQSDPPPILAYSNKKTAQIIIICAVKILIILMPSGAVDHMQVYPPSTGRLTPVTYVVAGEARKHTAVSSSPSLPYLSRGIIVLALAWKNSESKVSFVRGL